MKSFVPVRTHAPNINYYSSPFIAAIITLALTLQFGCYVPSGTAFLDGKQISLSNDLVFDGGVHSLTVTGNGVVQYVGSLSGPGELHIDLPQSATMIIEGDISQVRLVVERGTVDLTKAGDRSSNVSVTGSGIVKRLANPIDISSGLRLWLDASRVWSIYQDTSKSIAVTQPGQIVGFWQSLDRWRGVSAVRLKPSGVTYEGVDGGVRFNKSELHLPDIEVRNEYTLAAVYRPVSLGFDQPSCVFVGWSGTASDLGLCYFTAFSGSNSVLNSVYYSGFWFNAAFIPIDMIKEGTTILFPNVNGVDTLASSTGDSQGLKLHLSGQQVANSVNPFVARNDISFAYYIGRRWDGDQFLIMDLKELVVASDAKVVDALNGYLAWHNGLQSQLTSLHPYKSAPPTAIIDQSGTSVYRSCEAGKTCLVSFQASCSPQCTVSERCGANGDCASGSCVNGKCGLPVCSPSCKTGSVCGSNGDCASGLCLRGFCSVDAMCTPNCLIGESCASAADCFSQNCLNNVCAPPACSPNCNTNSRCIAPGNCLSGICTNSVCSAPTCASTASKCPLDSKCSVGAECASTLCISNVCKSCAPSCSIGVACSSNSDCYSGVCGPSKVCASPACSPKCMVGAKCVAGTDCISTKCSASNLCETNTCSPGCLKDVGCSVGSECLSKSCVNNVCASPVCSPNCKVNEACYGNGDCLSNICDKNKCTSLPCWTATTKCVAGTKCADNTQCASGTCQNFLCT